mmetsp:Transcript_1214/g.1696  ORF Transcript_1214/g.1696 Transcript_1214/m.1696 type:complete len:213 (+) Transcript_1214:619-1257(+)
MCEPKTGCFLEVKNIFKILGPELDVLASLSAVALDLQKYTNCQLLESRSNNRISMLLNCIYTYFTNVVILTKTEHMVATESYIISARPISSNVLFQSVSVSHCNTDIVFVPVQIKHILYNLNCTGSFCGYREVKDNIDLTKIIDVDYLTESPGCCSCDVGRSVLQITDIHEKQYLMHLAEEQAKSVAVIIQAAIEENTLREARNLSTKQNIL